LGTNEWVEHYCSKIEQECSILEQKQDLVLSMKFVKQPFD